MRLFKDYRTIFRLPLAFERADGPGAGSNPPAVSGLPLGLSLPIVTCYNLWLSRSTLFYFVEKTRL
jgi:hypothetical protein